MNLNFLLSLLALAGLAQAQSAPVTCTAATLTGTRSLVLTGRNVTTGGVFSKSYYGVGSATFDGAGKVVFNLTSDTNQAANTTQALSGTYAIPANCVGTVNITAGDTATFTLIPYNTGNSYSLTGQDATYNFTGSGSAQPTACLTSTLSGAYTFSGNGFAVAASTIGGVDTLSGILTFDGAGAVTGSWTSATNSVLTTVTLSGKYTVSSTCAATAAITDSNGAAYSMGFTVTSADGANFTAMGSSATSLFLVNGHNTFTNPGLAVGNAAGVSGGTPPGSLLSIYGAGLSTGQAQATSFPLPTSAASATVMVNNEAVPLTYVDKTQINAQLPLDIPAGVATLVVKNGSTVSNAVTITVPGTPVPGVFIYGSNHAVAQNYPSYALNATGAGAAVGDTVIVYFTGGGAVQGQSSIATGHATPNALFPLTATATATINGVPATVSFAGLTPGYAGLFQANIVVPNVPAGSHALVLTVGGVASNSSQITVK